MSENGSGTKVEVIPNSMLLHDNYFMKFYSNRIRKIIIRTVLKYLARSIR